MRTSISTKAIPLVDKTQWMSKLWAAPCKSCRKEAKLENANLKQLETLLISSPAVRQGIFCPKTDDHVDDLNITFIDANERLFECRVLPGDEDGSPREVLVGFCLVGPKRPADSTVVKSRSLPEKKSPPRSDRATVVRLNKLPLSKMLSSRFFEAGFIFFLITVQSLTL